MSHEDIENSFNVPGTLTRNTPKVKAKTEYRPKPIKLILLPVTY